MKKIFLDTETTGLEPNNGDRIVEIAAIAYNDHTLIPAAEGGEYHQYINPERDMPEEARQIHGLSDDFLRDKPVFAAIVDDFIEFVRDGELIIHNADFDRGFLNAELKRLGKPPLEEIVADITCSLLWSRANNPNLSAHNLNALCQHYNISLADRRDYHSAIVDTRLLGELYFVMRQQQGEITMTMPALHIQATGGAVPVRRATEAELAAHDALLTDMEQEAGKAGGGLPIYRQQSA